ncbi:MAG: beta-xylosidase [Saprospiraceae bacterium]|nr:beta-xylosidase [Saprospiraceae bacterium]
MKSLLKNISILFSLLFFITLLQSQSATITVDLSKTVGKMSPIWANFGYDEPNYTYTTNGKKLLRQISALGSNEVYIRTHNLLTSKGENPGPDLKWGYTDVYTEDSNGRPKYNWTVVDSIIDTYVSFGLKPIMEIGFMPKALSTKAEPYAHQWSTGGNLWTGWTYPPNDYEKWSQLVFEWVKHSINRYGKDEVKTWLWEVWNEPDIPYFSGTFEEYCKMYDYAAMGLKAACSECIIGGPHTTSPRNPKGQKYLSDFIKHCLYEKNHATGQIGSPLEYLAFHAKGSPELINGQVRMNMGAQLEDIRNGFKTISSFPELKNIPIVIGESDPEGCAACSETREPKYAYRNNTMYSSYTAASFAKIYELCDEYNVNLKAAVSWSFEFEDQAWFAGFRDLATNGINKPVFNVFQLFGKMSGQRVSVSGSDALSAAEVIANGVTKSADIGALAVSGNKKVTILLWNYHDDNDLKVIDEKMLLQIKGLKTDLVQVKQYMIDQNHSNAYTAWLKMGSPQKLSLEHYKTLEEASQLAVKGLPMWSKVASDYLSMDIDMPRQAVSLIELTW